MCVNVSVSMCSCMCNYVCKYACKYVHVSAYQWDMSSCPMFFHCGFVHLHWKRALSGGIAYLWKRNSFIHLFIQAISIAPLLLHYYSEAHPTTAMILCRS